MAALAYLIIGGFMCISSGFCTYGCYRCFTDKEDSRVASECSIKKEKRRKSSTKPASKFKTTNKESGSTLSSFNGTIYTIASNDSLLANENNLQKKLINSHDYALSINPQLVEWTINPYDREVKTWGKARKTKTAPI